MEYINNQLPLVRAVEIWKNQKMEVDLKVKKPASYKNRSGQISMPIGMLVTTWGNSSRD